MNFKPFFYLFLICLAFFFMLFSQTLPNVLALDIQQDLNLSVATLPAIASATMLGSALMQIPSGMMTDRFGGKVTLVVMLLIMGVGCLGFAFAPNVEAAIVSRLFTGIGNAYTVPMLALAALWFSKEAYGRASSVLVTCGYLGVSMALGPLAWANTIWGWRSCVLWLGIFVLILALFVYVFIPCRTSQNTTMRSARMGTWQTIKFIFSNRNFRCFMAWFLFVPSVSLTLKSLWWAPFLIKSCGMEPQTAANMLSAVTLLMLPATPLAGWLSDSVLKARKPILVVSSCLAAVALPLLICLGGSSSVVLHFFVSLPFVICLTAGMPILYASTNETFPLSVLGTAMAVLTEVNLIGIVLAQTLFGMILKYALGTGNNYVEAFHFPMAFLEVLLLLAFVCMLRMKETYGQRPEEF